MSRKSILRPDALVLQPGDAMSVAAHRILSRHFARFLSHEEGVRAGIDPEHIHDMRVAARRMRAALSLFHHALPAARVAWLRVELRWIAGALGRIRDYDVARELLEADLEAVPVRLGIVMQQALDEFARRRVRAHSRMRAVLAGSRYRELVRSTARFLARPPAARGPEIGRIAADLIRRRARKVRRMLPTADASRIPAETLHELRIQAKKLRYACEFLRDVQGRCVCRMIHRIVTLQTVLGRHQDLIVVDRALERNRCARKAGVPWRRALAAYRAGQRRTFDRDFAAAAEKLHLRRFKRLLNR